VKTDDTHDADVLAPQTASRSTAGATGYQKIADDLRSQVLSQELQPGHRLVEAELATTYGVSRGTVREALRLLASERVVETVRGRSGGSYVARVAPESVSAYLHGAVEMLLSNAAVRLEDLVEVRQLIEPYAARLAADRHRPGPLAVLRSQVALSSDPNRDQRNWEWHATILRLSGNPLLPTIASPVYHLLSARFDRSLGAGKTWQTIEDEHRAITELIEKGDSAGAEEAMRSHLNIVHLTYLDLAAAGDDD
jgi:DNA-binding FadR family transcriptional regulator